jgi:hypothetical protein
LTITPRQSRYIRETMERAGYFTAVPGWGSILMGLSAMLAAGLASPCAREKLGRRVAGEAAVAFALGCWTMIRKAKTARVFLKGPGRIFALSLCPAMVAALVLTLVLYRHGVFSLLPGLWLLLYGVAIVAGGTYSVRVVPVMGVCFMVLGTAALVFGAAGRICRWAWDSEPACCFRRCDRRGTVAKARAAQRIRR